MSKASPFQLIKRSVPSEPQVIGVTPGEQGNDDLPVTLHISRRVRPGFEPDYEAMLSTTIDAVKAFQGFHDVIVLRPSHPMDQEYRVILHFEHYRDLQRWEQSKIRRYFLQQLDQYAMGIIVNLMFSMLLPELPMIARNVIFTVVVGWSLTYLIMPRLTRLFSNWLYP
jgi:uncharacterized protein